LFICERVSVDESLRGLKEGLTTVFELRDEVRIDAEL